MVFLNQADEFAGPDSRTIGQGNGSAGPAGEFPGRAGGIVGQGGGFPGQAAEILGPAHRLFVQGGGFLAPVGVFLAQVADSSGNSGAALTKYLVSSNKFPASLTSLTTDWTYLLLS